MKAKKPSVKKLKDKADKVFSEYIRRKYADAHTELVSCYTCGVSKPWKEQQNGHYISRGSNHLRYDERNCRVQCVGCNVFRKGNYPAYAAALVREKGAEILDILEEESKTLHQWKPYELEEIISEYQTKMKALTR